MAKRNVHVEEQEVEVVNEVKPAQELELEQKAVALSAQVLKWTDVPVVKRTREWYAGLAEFLKPCKDLSKQIQDYFKPMKDAAHLAHKAVCDREKAELVQVDNVIKLGTRELNAYLAHEREQQLAEQRRLERENEEKARKEREKLERQAAKAEEKGQVEKAEGLREQAQDVYVAPAAQVVAPTVVKSDNLTAYTQMDTEVEVVDLEKFLRALLAKGMKPTMVEVKAGPLKAWAKANGLEAFEGLSIRKVPKARIK